MERGDFLEYAEVHGNRYGTLKADILTLLEQGKNVVMDIDVQGAGQVRSCREGILPLCYADVYIYGCRRRKLKNRLCGRQTDGAETIALRLRNAEQEDACLPQYQYCLVSSDRETDYASFCALLKCQSMRVGLMRDKVLPVYRETAFSRFVPRRMASGMEAPVPRHLELVLFPCLYGM